MANTQDNSKAFREAPPYEVARASEFRNALDSAWVFLGNYIIPLQSAGVTRLVPHRYGNQHLCDMEVIMIRHKGIAHGVMQCKDGLERFWCTYVYK